MYFTIQYLGCKGTLRLIFLVLQFLSLKLALQLNTIDISLQFSKKKFGNEDASEMHKNKEGSNAKYREPLYRLNRIYLVYLHPIRSKKNKMKYDTSPASGNRSVKTYSSENCHKPRKKLKSSVLPDPWTSRTQRLVKRMLCKGCREYNLCVIVL